MSEAAEVKAASFSRSSKSFPCRIEYSLFAAGIRVAMIAAVNGLGSQVEATFGSVDCDDVRRPLIRSRLRKTGHVSGLS